jgi:hypothetical protein
MAESKNPKSGKTKLSTQDLELSVLDLDNLDDPFAVDELASGHETQPGAVKRFVAGFRRGFLDEKRFKRHIRSLVVGALPDGYSHAYHAAASARSQLETDFQQLRVENPATLMSLLEKTERVLPKIKSRAPKRLYSRLEERVAKVKSELGYELDYQRKSDRSQAEIDEGHIVEGLRDLHILTEARREHAESERQLQGMAERSLRDQVEKGRFLALNDHLSHIGTSLAQQNQYQEKITYHFQRKTLELQYRTYFVLRDMRQMTAARMMLEQQSFLRRNPEAGGGLFGGMQSPAAALAAHQAAMGLAGGTGAGGFTYGSQIKRQLTNKAVNRVSGYLPAYLAEFYPNLRQNLMTQAAQFLQNIDQLAGQGEMLGSMGGMLGRGDRSGIAGDLAGEGMHGLLGSFIVPRLARAMRPAFNRAGDKAGGQNHLLAYYLNNFPALLQEYTQDLNQSSGWRGVLQNFVRSVAPSYYQDDEIKDGTYQSINKEATFNQLTQRSIVDIIPGYLSRILHEARMIRTGRDDLEREVYDITTGKFTGVGSAAKAMAGRVVNETTRRQINTTLDDVVDRYDPDGKLSPAAREALRERLLRDAATNGRFDPGKYASGSGYGSNVTDEAIEELSGFFNNIFDLDADGKIAKDVENRRRLNAYSNVFLELRNIIPDPRKEIRRVHGVGSQELLRELGLVSTHHGVDRIDFERLFGMYRGANGTDDNVGLSDFTDAPKEQPRSFKETLSEQVDRRIDSALAGLTGVFRKPVADELQDLHLQDSPTPLLMAREMQAGNYVDENTGKTVRSFKDITGAIRHRLGFVVATADEVFRGLFTRDGKSVQTGVNTNSASFKEKAQSFHETLRTSPVNDFIQEQVKVQDLYTQGSEQAALLARDIKAGKYRDVNTGKIIEDFEDITGEVRDLDGNIVVTDAELQNGLFDAQGKQRVDSLRRRLARGYLSVTTLPARLLGKGLVRGGGALIDRLREENDAYLPDTEQPVLTKRGIKRGEYYNAETGRALQSFDDVNGDIVDRDGNLVLAAADIPRLITRRGGKHRAASKPGLVRKLLGKAARAYMRWTVDYYKKLPGRLLAAGKGAVSVGKGAVTAAKAVGTAINPMTYVRGASRLGKWMFGKGRNQPIPDSAIQTPTDGILARIYEVLSTRLPDDEPRKGSWQQILADRAKGKASLKEKGKAEKPTNPFAGLTAGLGKLFDLFKKREEDEEGFGLDDAADVADIADAVDGDGDKKRRRKPKGRKPKGKMGRLGKLWNAAKTSRLGRFVGGAGRLALSGAGWLARGALTAGTALVSVVGAPVVLGTAAVAAAGTVGYMYYKRRKQASGVFRELRLTQYGISPNGWGAPGKILHLEKIFEDVTRRNDGDQPTFDLGRLDPQRIFEVLEVDTENEEDIKALADWVEGRFKPIYLTYQKALMNLAPTVPLSELDEKLPKELGLALLDQVKFPYSGNTPYAITASPFGADDELSTDVDDIKEREEAVREHYRDAKPKEDKTAEKATVATAAIANNAVQAAKVAPPVTPVARSTSRRGQGTAVVAGSSMLAVAANRGFGGERLTVVASSGVATNQVLTSLQAIRLRAYGLDRLLESRVQALFELEDAVFSTLIESGNGEITHEGGYRDYAIRFAGAFGLNTTDEKNRDVYRFNRWFMERFLQVLIRYALAVRKFNRTTNLATIEGTLSDQQKLKVGRELVDLHLFNGDDLVPVWRIPRLVWLEEDQAAAEAHARADLLLLETNAKKKEQELSTPTQRAIGGTTTPSAANTSGSQTQKSQAVIQQGQQQTAIQRAINAWKTDTAGLIRPTSPMIDVPRQPGGQVVTRGNAFGGIAQGNGGVWEEIPLPKSNKSYQGALPTLEAVAKMTGVDAGLLATFCSIESGFDYTVKAKTSSASGWFQFINATWDEQLRLHGAKYGIPPDDAMRSLRLDPRINALMGAEFLKGNFNYLQKELGRTPTDTDLYLAHFMGPYGAVQFLKQDSNANAAQVFPKQASANRSIFFKPSGQARTIGEVYALMDEKVSKHRYGAGKGVNVGQHAANDPTMSGSAAGDNVTIGPDGQAVAQLAPGDVTGAFQSTNNPFANGTQKGQSMAQRAESTVNPYNQVATGVLGTGVGSPSPTPTAGTEEVPSAGASDPVVQHNESIKRQAIAADRRQQEQTGQAVQHNREMGQLLAKQLETQMEMRDYLRTIAETFGGIKRDGLKVQGGGVGAGSSSNDTSKPTTAPAGRPAGNSPAPISLRR